MAGNKLGGKKASATNKKLYGDDFYKKIGAKGGKKGKTGGFYNDPERARIAGAKGGRISRKTGPHKRELEPIEPNLLEKLRKALKGVTHVN